MKKADDWKKAQVDRNAVREPVATGANKHMNLMLPTVGKCKRHKDRLSVRTGENTGYRVWIAILERQTLKQSTSAAPMLRETKLLVVTLHSD